MHYSDDPNLPITPSGGTAATTMTTHWTTPQMRPQDDVIGPRGWRTLRQKWAVFATDNILTTAMRACLCDGFLEGHEIECPLHQGKFDVRNGNPTSARHRAPAQLP